MTDTEPKSADPLEEAPLPKPLTGTTMTSPVDLPPMEDGEAGDDHPVRWAAIAIATATAFLAIFNASALQGWAFGLTPSAETQPVVEAAVQWNERTSALGLDRPYRAMHEAWQGLVAIEFGGDDGETANEEDIAPPPPTTAEDDEQASEPGFSGL
ncbi:hypothetical protein [uncultured Parasphingopyxis sp.]|uniref:hypothetical protein n=1 Tax=uncultured Parasphingopyxis sp. TaxID=1547918 RepID=UPI002609C182|nr:hypothetical protein [uncultured Parasphingopyxis sp.]